MIQINDFSAGANNYIDRAKLGEKVAVMMRDCIPETGSLESGYNDLPVPAESPVDLGHWGDSDRSVAKQFGRTYWSNNLAQSAPYYGGDHYALGVPYPDFPPELSTTDDEGSERKGRYRYCMTYVRAGYESAPGPVGDGYFSSIELAEGKAVRYLAGAPPEGITAVNVYRTVAEGAEFYLLESLTPEEAAALRTDKLADNDLLMHNVLESLYYLPPPDGGKYLTEQSETFFLAVGDKLYYSEVSNCHAWNPSSWISFEDDITGIVEEFQGILVLTANRVYRVTGNDVLTIAKQEIPTRQGCTNWRSCATLSNAPIWLSNDGLCMWDGQSVKLLSFQRYRIDNTPRFAVSANDCYWLFGDRGVIVYDLRSGGIFYSLSTLADYAWYDVDKDTLYLRREGVYYRQGASRTRRTGFYRSALLGGNLPLTQMRKLRISSSGMVEVTLRNHLNKVVFKGTVPGGATREIWLPSGKWTRGCEIEVSFTGTLREIALTPVQAMA